MTDLRDPENLTEPATRWPEVIAAEAPAGPDEPSSGPDAETPGQQWFGLVGLVGALVAVGWFLGPNVLIMILAIVLSIFLHEMGHFIAARRSGMKATEFFLGFGPRVWSFTRGETTYGVKAIWAGAYVKIIGMSNLEEVPAADEARSFRRQSYPKRFITAFAGPGMNLLLAFVLLTGLAAFHGGLPRGEQWPEVDPGAGSAAAEAGMLPGDRLVSLDGEPLPEFADFREMLADRGGAEVEFVVDRDGDLLTLPVVLDRRAAGIIPRDWPETFDVAPDSPAGVANLNSGDQILTVNGDVAPETFAEFADSLIALAGETATFEVERDGQRYVTEMAVPTEMTNEGLLGVTPFFQESEPQGVVRAVPVAAGQLAELTSASVGALMSFFSPSGLSGFAEIVVTTPPGDNGSEPAAAPTVTEDGSLPALPEPTRMAMTDENRVLSILGIISLGSEMDLARILILVALVNVFLAVFNLIPLLPFDGGHIVVATYERVREGLARTRLVGARLEGGRYFADFTKLIPLTYAVVGLIIAVGLGALWLDIVDPPSISG